MKLIKKINEFISSTSYSKLFSMIEISMDGVFYKIFYSPLKDKISFIETTGNVNEILPFKKGDNIKKVFDLAESDDNVKIVKIKRKR